MALEHPARHQVDRTDQSGLIGVMYDRHDFDVDAGRFKNDHGPGDCQFAKVAPTKAAENQCNFS